MSEPQPDTNTSSEETQVGFFQIAPWIVLVLAPAILWMLYFVLSGKVS